MSVPRRPGDGTGLERRRRAVGHAALVTAITTAVTGCAHSLAGGAAPTPLLLAAACMATLAVLAPVLGAAAGWPRRIVAVAIAQVVQHALYSLPQPVAPSIAGHDAPHAHHAPEVLPSGIVSAAGHDHGDMLLAHVVAGAVTIATIAAGRELVRAVLGTLRGDALVRLVAMVVPLGTTRPRPVRAARPVAPASRAVLRSPVARRGPPALAV